MEGLFNIDLTQGEENLIDLEEVVSEETTETTEVVETTAEKDTGGTETVITDETDTEDTIEIEDTVTENIKEDSTSTVTTQETSEKTEDIEKTSSLASYAAVLQEEGILPNLDLEEFAKIEDIEEQSQALIKANEDRINEGISSWVNDLPDRLKNIIENYQDGASLETLIKADSNTLEYGKITEDEIINDESLQENLVITDFMDKGFDEATAKSMAQSLKDSDKLEEQAKRSHSVLKGKDAERIEAEKVTAKEQELALKQESEKQLKSLTTLVTNTTEIIPGVTLTKAVKDKVMDSMTKPVGYDNEGRPISKIIQARNENPQMFEMKLHYLFNLTNGFEDFSKITNVAKTKVVKGLSERLLENKPKTGRPARINDNKENVSNDILASIKHKLSDR